MSKPIMGIIFGAILGCIDGLHAWFYPDARPEMFAIILGSTFKGLVAGWVAGFVSSKKNSLSAGVIAGTITAFLFAVLIVWMGKMEGSSAGNHPIAIILPGTAVGTICGFAAHRLGKPAAARAA